MARAMAPERARSVQTYVDRLKSGNTKSRAEQLMVSRCDGLLKIEGRLDRAARRIVLAMRSWLRSMKADTRVLAMESNATVSIVPSGTRSAWPLCSRCGRCRVSVSAPC